MLSNLVPGIRELRAPLAAGYIWLAFGWLVWGRHFPDLKHSTGLLKEIQTLGHSAGTPSVGVALSFAAYLIGVLSVALSDWLLKNRAERLTGVAVSLMKSKMFRRAGLRLMNQETTVKNMLEWAVRQRLKSRHVDYLLDSMVNPSIIESDFLGMFRSKMIHPSRGKNTLSAFILSGISPSDIDEYDTDLLNSEARDGIAKNLVDSMVSDLPLVPARLLGHDAELYDNYDRQRAEAQFRAAVAVPLIPATIALSIAMGSLVVLVIILMAIVLLATTYQKRQAADFVLAEAICAGRVDTPALDILNVLDEATKPSTSTQDSETLSGNGASLREVPDR